MSEVLKQLPRAKRGQAEPRKAVTVRLPAAVLGRVRLQASRLGISETEATARLILAGLDQVEGAADPNEQWHALGFTLAAIADRLDQLDRVAGVTARAAVKGSMIARRELLARAGDSDKAKTLDGQLNEAVEAHLSEHGITP